MHTLLFIYIYSIAFTFNLHLSLILILGAGVTTFGVCGGGSVWKHMLALHRAVERVSGWLAREGHLRSRLRG